uniref:Iron-sulfur cluster assembly 2 homolog, mitochondrial n=1 Tax=Globodera pallida TaxID=36090 RepID=A0A183C4A3_GLOPA
MAPPVLPSLAILRQRAAIVRQMFRRRFLFNFSTFTTATSVPSHSSAPLIVTQRAVDQLRRIAASGEHLRICVDSGGCSGFEYKLMLDKRLDEREDEVINASEGATVVVDKLSLEFLRGSKLDYAEDLMRSAFRITDNPQATQGCSCGASFAPKNQIE